MTAVSAPASRLVILDWDDTVLPTNVILERDGRVKLADQYVSVAYSLLALVKGLAGEGSVYIVSSSTEGWVEQSCAHFAPALLPLLQNVCVLHTPREHRTLAARQKEPTFAKIATKWYRQLSQEAKVAGAQVLLVGNMPGDVRPARTLRSLLPGVGVKTCLLKEVPTVLELERQLTYLTHSLCPLLDDASTDDFSVADASAHSVLDGYASALAAARSAVVKDIGGRGRVGDAAPRTAVVDFAVPVSDKVFVSRKGRRMSTREAMRGAMSEVVRSSA